MFDYPNADTKTLTQTKFRQILALAILLSSESTLLISVETFVYKCYNQVSRQFFHQHYVIP